MIHKLKGSIPGWIKFRLFIKAAMCKFVPSKEWILDDNLSVIRFTVACSVMTIVYRVVRRLIAKLRAATNQEKPERPCEIEYMLSAALASAGLMIMVP